MYRFARCVALKDSCTSNHNDICEVKAEELYLEVFAFPYSKPTFCARSAHNVLHRSSQSSRHRTAEIAKKGLGAVPPRCAHDATSRMRSRGAHVERVDRAPVIRVIRHRTGEGELVEGHGAVEDVSFMQCKDALEVERGERVGADDGGGETRAVLLDDSEDSLHEGLFERRVCPAAVLRIDVVRRVLDEELHNVLAGWRECVVECAVGMIGGRRDTRENEGGREQERRVRVRTVRPCNTSYDASKGRKITTQAGTEITMQVGTRTGARTRMRAYLGIVISITGRVAGTPMDASRYAFSNSSILSSK